MNEEEIYLTEKKEKQQKIINSIHEIYVLYPETEKMAYQKTILEIEKKVINVEKGKNELIAITSAASGIAVASLMDLHLNLASFATVLGLISLGGSTFFRINYENINEINELKKEYKKIKKMAKQKKSIYQNALYNYIYSILEYLECCDKNIDFTDEIGTIFNKNNEYITKKIDNKDFKEDFNLEKAIKLHYDVFGDIKLFNQEIMGMKDEYDEEQNRRKVMIKKNDKH